MAFFLYVYSNYGTFHNYWVWSYLPLIYVTFQKNFVQLGNVIKLIKSQLLQNEPLRRNWLPSISSHALGTIVNSWMADCEHGCVWSEKVQSNPFSILFMIRIFIETSIWFTHILWLPLYTKVHSKCRSVAFLPRRQIALSRARNS